MTANENDPPRGTLRELAGWLVAGLILAVGGGYWLAMRSSEQPPVVQPSVPATTGVLPQVGNAAAPVAQANRPAAAKSRSPAKPAAPPSHPATPRQPASKTMSAPHATSAAPAKAAKAAPAEPVAKRRVKPRAGQARRRESPVFPVGGAAARGPQMAMPQASGPLVDLGAFSDLHQARLAWREMERAHPALKHYRAWIIANRDWNGRQFYQFQLAAASPMDSQMLCFFLRHRGFRCDVVGR